MNYNDYNTQKLRGLKRKLELIKSRGGKCELCSYEVFIDSNTTRIGLEKKRMINRQWLPGQGSEKCAIVPEELFNKVVKYYQEMCAMAEKIRDREL